jgi:RNA polymerase sigma-70 factor (ECF subfamily)
VRELPQSQSGEVLSEAETIRRAQKGDAAAFEKLYRLHSGRVFSLCVRMLKNPAEAEDLTQETFLTVFRRIGTFRGESAFSTWLHRVAANHVLMHIRKNNIAQTSLEEMTEKREENDAPRREFSVPDLYLNGSVDRLTLQKAIEQLPPGFRAQFVLYDIQGYEHREIADMLGFTTGTSKSQLHRTRRRLRELLQADRNNDTPEKSQPANRFPFGAGAPGDRDYFSPVDRSKIIPFRRKKDRVIEELTREIDDSATCA